MSTSVLDLKTRILSSKARTTIQRADFNIAGDSVEFDTNSKDWAIDRKRKDGDH